MNDTTNLLSPLLSDRDISSIPRQVTADGMSAITDAALKSVEVLTLDCFDTLLWRQTEKPTDVFYALQHRPTFKKLGFTADLRIKVEEIARRRQFVKKGSHEVGLREIYLAFSSTLSEAELQSLMDEELTEEMNQCFVYQPTLTLIKRALTLGKKVSIVSDTYLTKSQLIRLLQDRLGESWVKQFHDVMVSCEYGVSKSQGLHRHSIKHHRTKSILHVGDHPLADVISAKEAGIIACHLEQYDKRIKELFRLRTNALSFFDTKVRQDTPAYTPFKALMANRSWKKANTAEVIGYAGLGPLMVAFANDIHETVTSLTKDGQCVKVLFLLRDGYLPYEVYRRLYPSANGSPVRISRFTAYAASFTDEVSIENYVSDVVGGGRYADIAKQCLMTAAEIQRLTRELDDSRESQREFVKRLLTKNQMKLIVDRSRAYRQRLMRYLSLEAGVADGDTLLLIDLGYSGTTQTRLAPVLKKEHKINVIGRYLLSLSTPGWQASRSGLLDPHHCDEKSLQTLVTYVALLEQLCTTTDKSVIDFNEAGQPIYGESNINEDQHEKLKEIQSATFAFAEDVARTEALASLSHHKDALRQVALAELGRLLFFPTQAEIEMLKSFKFDLNLGTTDLFDVFDEAKGLDGLRTRGMFFMEKNLKTMRTNYPAELRNCGLELLLTLLAQHRHGLTITRGEMSYRECEVSVIVMKGDSVLTEVFQAKPTYDGYYDLTLPAGYGDFTMAVVLGEQLPWIQVHSVSTIPLSRLNADTESLYTQDIRPRVLANAITVHEHQLYESTSPSSALMISPFEVAFDEPMVIRLVFRPL